MTSSSVLDPISSPPPIQSPSQKQDLWIVPLAFCLILVSLFASTRIRNFDLGTDLKTGQWILEHHAFPQKDEFTYTCKENDYLDAKSLYQIATYLIYKVFNYQGITLFNTACVVLVFLLLWVRLRLTQAPSWLVFILLFTAALGMERRFFPRAEIISWVLFSVLLLILERRARGKTTPLWLAPVILWLWVNVEGIFILGWVTLGFFILNSLIQKRGLDRKLLKVSFVSVGVCLLNPYGPKLWLLPFTYFSEFKNSGNSDLVSPVKFLLAQNLKVDWNLHLFLYLGFCFILGMAFLLTYKSRKFHEWSLATVFFGLSCLGYRNVPLFFLVSLPILASSWVQLAPLTRLLFPKTGLQGTLPRMAPILAGISLALLGLRVWTGAYYISDRRMARVGLGLDTETIPVKVADFLTSNHLDGRLMNYIGMGDWLIWKGPQKVFIDGRHQVLSADFYSQYLDSFNARGLAQLAAIYQPQLVALNYNDSIPWAVQLKMMPEWRLIYADESFAIYAKKDYAPSIPEFSFPKLLQERNISLAADQIARIIEETQPSQWSRWFEGFYRPQIYPNGLQSMGLFALHYMDFQTSQALFAESLRQARGGYWDVFYNLGVATLRMNQYALGKNCLEKALQMNPGNSSTIQMLESLKNY